MSKWPASKAGAVYRALLRIGWKVKRKSGHVILERPGWPDYPWGFHDGVEIGPGMLAKIAKHTGLQPDDL